MSASEFIEVLREFTRQEAANIYREMRQQELKEERKKLPSKTMTRKEAMAYLGVSPSTLSRMVRRKELKRIFVGGAVRFRKADLDNYLTR